jgi:radical SAM/Cys-rich protein
MSNPPGAAIAPDQQMLEKAYRDNLEKEHSIHFNRLIALSNMPIGRLGKTMSETEKQEFMNLLEENFNLSTIPNLMCRHLISVSPDGRLYDCDFWQVLMIPVKNGSATVHSFNLDLLKNREIVTNGLCFLCTAGAGASCSGALT